MADVTEGAVIHPQLDFYLFVAVLAIALHLWFRFVTRVCDAVVRWRLEKDFKEMERLHRIRQQVGQRFGRADGL